MSDQNKIALGAFPESVTINQYGAPGASTAMFTLFKTATGGYTFTCQVQITQPSIAQGNYVGSVSGFVNSLGVGGFTKLVNLHGTIIQEGANSPGILFQASMQVDNSWNGQGGFTYADVHVEKAPVKATNSFELVTWFTTWNKEEHERLRERKVPLNYATRYNLAFGSLVPVSDNEGGGYTVAMNNPYDATEIKNLIQQQAPGVKIFAGLQDGGISETVTDNKLNKNRSTKNMVAWLQENGYNGISIDAEGAGMSSVAEFVTQLGESFRIAGLGIAISVPWPGNGPTEYGPNAVQDFNENVQALELQDYSSRGTLTDTPVWISAGIKPGILLGGVSTEDNSAVGTSLENIHIWTLYAKNNGLGGMFSWRLDNDYCKGGQPTYTGAMTVYNSANS